MGVRITGVSTPVGGVSWEYSKPKEDVDVSIMNIKGKIKVFVSSICGVAKYDKVRAELKQIIEETKLADVYLFEEEGASSLSARQHYLWGLEDCDVCIFLIDNQDDVTTGVQEEIDVVNKNNIKSLYYFCNEITDNKTQLELSLKGAHFAKSTAVNKFDELSTKCAKELINDIVSIYHHYCKGRIIDYEQEEIQLQDIEVAGSENARVPIIPKASIKNIDKSKNYIMDFIFDSISRSYNGKDEKTSQLDEWCVQFLRILFEGKSITEFNTGIYLELLKEQQDEVYHPIVELRWKAIQQYFMGDVGKCIECLQEALVLAKQTEQSSWIIKDILIDIRNQHWVSCTTINRFKEPDAQVELNESEEDVYYPILDRIYESLQEKYIEGLYKNKIDSPYTVEFANNISQLVELLASALVLSMYNGSLTHIILFYKKVKEFLFYLSSRYDDWKFRRDLFMFSVFLGKEKEIKGIQEAYPEVLNKLNSYDALKIMMFCNNHSIEYKKINSQLLGFGAVGYYLSDEDFNKYENEIIDKIESWLNSDNPSTSIGANCFICLSGVAERMSQDKLAMICCMFMNKHFGRWYTDMFKFIRDNIDLNKMTRDTANKLLQGIINILENEKEREQIKTDPSFLYILRRQERELTNQLDEKIKENYEEFYNDTYKLETTEEIDLLGYVKSALERIRSSNKKQGKGGIFFGHGIREIATIRSILHNKKIVCDNETMDAIIEVTVETLMISKEDIHIKLDAVSLLTFIVLRYPEVYEKNKDIYIDIHKRSEEIEEENMSDMFSNIDVISLEIALQFLYSAMGVNVYIGVLELMPYIKDDRATIITVTDFIVEYLKTSASVRFEDKLESLILQNVLNWLREDTLQIRWNATRILIAMLRNIENRGVINNKLVKLIDEECSYIKILIIRQLYKNENILEDTKQYIMTRCENDTNYLVRTVCKEQKESIK